MLSFVLTRVMLIYEAFIEHCVRLLVIYYPDNLFFISFPVYRFSS